MTFPKALIAATLFASSLLGASAAQASIVPFGVQNDVAAATVTNTWGFTQCFSATYGTLGLTTAGMLSGCQGDYLMVAARRTGSSVYEVLAAANYADVTYDTGTSNTTHVANGVGWYFNNNYSWGFAGATDVVSRNSCDTAGGAERDRLCWHTHIGYSGGYRAGSFNGLNGDNGWEKVLLVGKAAPSSNVPEPASLALVGAALMGLALARKRKAN
ncbi:MAG: PEP-CTERM sorting domain-containing protein [Burkholderiaceae bacterium]|nr:PEP-CTERM sorting domain-containing protein [Burkholderiaceae bacterium]